MYHTKEQYAWLTRDSSESLTKKERFARKNSYFLTVFPFLCPRANHSRRSSLICSFLKSDLSDSLPPLFTKEWPWAIRSGRSWQKSDGNDSLISLANRSFALSLTKNERIARKTGKWIPNPGLSPLASVITKILFSFLLWHLFFLRLFYILPFYS